MIVKARSSFHLGVLEAVNNNTRKPVICDNNEEINSSVLEAVNNKTRKPAICNSDEKIHSTVLPNKNSTFVNVGIDNAVGPVLI